MENTYHLLYSELSRIQAKLVDTDTLYFVNKKTGELIPVVDVIPQDVNSLINKIKKAKSKRNNFVIMYQSSHQSLSIKLSSSAMTILSFLVSKMVFDNCVYGLSYRDLSAILKLSTRTIGRCLSELQKNSVICISSQKGKSVYLINPAYAWRGSFHRTFDKLETFKEKIPSGKNKLVKYFNDGNR